MVRSVRSVAQRLAGNTESSEICGVLDAKTVEIHISSCNENEVTIYSITHEQMKMAL